MQPATSGQLDGAESGVPKSTVRTGLRGYDHGAGTGAVDERAWGETEGVGGLRHMGSGLRSQSSGLSRRTSGAVSSTQDDETYMSETVPASSGNWDSEEEVQSTSLEPKSATSTV